MTEPLGNPEKILIIRLSAIGDLVMASPLIDAFRRTYPHAHLAWLVQSEARAILTADPALDEVIVWPRSHWRRLWQTRQWRLLRREATAFVKQLRAKRFDTVIDIQGLLKSAIWARLSGASQRIGLDSREGSARLMTRVITAPRGCKRISSEYQHLALTLGLEGNDFHMHVALSDADEAFARQLVREYGMQNGYAVLCPFTTREQKHWPEDRWAALARDITERFGMRAILLGGEDDTQAAARIQSDAGKAILSLAGKTSLREAAALIKHGALTAGVDTGLTHMGIAFDVPTIAIFGSTCPYLDTGRERAVVLHKSMDCSPCRRHPTCNGAFTCMQSITVNDVLTSAAALLRKP